MIFTKKNIVGAAVVMVLIIVFGIFCFSLESVNADAAAPSVIFSISQGEGFRQIGAALKGAGLIRSAIAFDIFALLDGRGFELKPGLYHLDPSMDTPRVIAAISGPSAPEATVTIPEGSNMYDIDRILSAALVIQPGALINFNGTSTTNMASTTNLLNLEGRLFPDTYQFYTNSSVNDVVAEMADDFNAKAQPLFTAAGDTPTSSAEEQTLIIASIVEKEVPDQVDQELVAGIILKRLAMGIPLDIDATVCYAKFQAEFQEEATSTSSTPGACSLTPLDFKIDSPYNTYLYKGLPPGPIGNPGTSAITAALHPQSSPYLYYLSDPKTGKTIFAKTLDEQNQNKVKYLESN
jgi:UPF0755 protein